MRFLRHLGRLLKDFLGFAWQNKAWWIIPVVVVMLLLAFLIEQLFFCGVEDTEQFGGLQQARGGDVIGAGGIQGGDVRELFGVDDDLRGQLTRRFKDETAKFSVLS